MSEIKTEITKANIDELLKEVAKEYRKRVGKNMPAEIILVGGASVLVNYGFRYATTDIDALIQAASGMKDAINAVGDLHGLDAGWLNTDFVNTDSYTAKLVQYSKYYRTFSNVLTVRTIAAEYLVAMKLRSGRPYKHDMSDVVGILKEHEEAGSAITEERVRRAVADLYGSWENLPEQSREFYEAIKSREKRKELYAEVEDSEQDAKTLLLGFEQKNPGTIRKMGASEVVFMLRKPKEEVKEQNETTESE